MTSRIGDFEFSRMVFAMEAPVMPLPIITTSASFGNSLSAPCWAMGEFGTVQYGMDEFRTGIPGDEDIRSERAI